MDSTAWKALSSCGSSLLDNVTAPFPRRLDPRWLGGSRDSDGKPRSVRLGLFLLLLPEQRQLDPAPSEAESSSPRLAFRTIWTEATFIPSSAT